MFGTIAMVGASLLAKGASNNASNKAAAQQYAQQAGQDMYATMTARLNGQDALSAVQKDIANLAQQKVQQDVAIKLQTDQQEAKAMVAAAAAGVEGGNVDQVHQEMLSNEAHALANNTAQTEDAIGNMAIQAGNAFNQIQTPLQKRSAPVMKNTLSAGDVIGAGAALYGAYENASLADIGKKSSASLDGFDNTGFNSNFNLAWSTNSNNGIYGFGGRDFAKQPLMYGIGK